MIDDVSDIADFYGDDPQREHDRLAEHQLEHDLTRRYLDEYLPERGSVLEIGAATGRYSLELAKRGYAVTAVDLSSELIEQAIERATTEGMDKRVRFRRS